MSTLALRPLRRRYSRSPHVLFRWRAGLPFPAGATFSRSSPAWYIGADGLLRQAAANVPRIDWSHGRPALRLERARTNGWSWSEVLGDSLWVKVGASIATNVARAPDGTMTMDKVVEDTSTGLHEIRRATPALTDNSNFVVTAFAKAGERSFLRIRFQDKAGTAHGAYFDVATGVVASTVGTVTARVREEADGAYRLECVFNAASGATTPTVFFRLASGDGGESYTGDGLSGLYLWGLQFEADQPVASSYIKTTSTTVTRAADLLALDWPHPPQAMTVYVRFTETGSAYSAVARIWEVGDGDNASPNIGVTSVTTGTPGYGVVRDSVATSVIAAPAIGATVEHIVTLSSAGVAMLAQYVNGTLTGTVSTPAIALPSSWGSNPRLYVGSAGTTRHGLLALRSYGAARGTLTLAQCREAFPEEEGRVLVA